jgi:CheY-like chemotaxis protein
MNAKPPHFLIVEADDDHADLIEAAFQHSSGEKTTDRVRTGPEALAYVRRQGRFAVNPRPDVVLLDWSLPDLGGDEVLRILKEDNELRTIPVLVLTDSAAQGDCLAAYELKANGVLIKPFSYDGFFEMIEALSSFWATWNQPPPHDHATTPAMQTAVLVR